ncbi:MAG: hypothetical protein ABH871_04530 [Pseudomonadota bacterium]
MKIYHLRVLMIVALAGMLIISACKKGGGGEEGVGGEAGEAEITPAQQQYESAIEALKSGDIRGARDKFTQAIEEQSASTNPASAKVKSTTDLTMILPQSHFGRALTNLILLIESAPITDLLAGFGQNPWSIDSIFGSSGYLSRLNNIYGADSININVSGQINGTIDKPYAVTDSYEGICSIYGPSCSQFSINSKIDEIGFGNAEDLWLAFKPEVLASGPSKASGKCNFSAGATLTPSDACTITQGNEQDKEYLFEASFGGNGYYFKTDEIKSTGSVTVDKLGKNIGDTIAVTFNNLTLFDSNNNTITLSGTFEDKLTERNASAKGLGFPFSTMCKEKNCIFSQMKSGYRTSNAIAILTGLQPLLDDMVADLEVAISSPSTSFDIPKELFFGSQNMHVSHADMLFLLGAVYELRAAINLLNSWTADTALHGLMDSNGNFIGNKNAVLTELNQFFHLKPDNELSQAQTNFSNSFGYFIQGLDEVLSGTAQGVVTKSADNQQFYDEIRDMVVSGNSALQGSAQIAWINPVINMDLAYLLGGNVDGSKINSYPFVLDKQGNIKAVEAYFSQLMQNVCSYSLTSGQGVKVFSDAVRATSDLMQKALPNILVNNRFGGKK